MTQCLKIAKAFLFALVVLAMTATAIAEDRLPSSSSPPSTLVLYSYGYGARGVEVFSDGFIQEAARQGEKVGETYFEYLDLERNKDPEYRSRLIAFLERKYRDRQIAAIVTIQQPALSFLLAEGKTLAPEALAITLQAPIPPVDSLRGRKIISVFARFDIEGTLRQALRIFPGTRRVVFVSGSSDADKLIAEDAWNAAAPWGSTIALEFTVDKAFEDIRRRVATLPPHSIVIFTQYNSDGKGHVAAAYEVEAMLVKEANAPVFGLYDFNLKNGGVGGSVISVTQLGSEAARLSQDVERGRLIPQSAITQQQVRPTLMFDWGQIVRWGGDTNALAPGAIALNKPHGLWEQHRQTVVAASMVLLVLSSLVIALATSRRRMVRTKEALRKSESYFRGIFERMADAVVVADTSRTITSVNPAFVRLFGYRAQEVVGQPVQLIYADPAMYKQMGMRVFNENAPADTPTVELEFRRKDGSTFWSEMKGVALRDPDGRVSGYLSVDRDITDRKASYLALSKFKAIVDSSDDAIISESLDGVITSWNAAAERIFGYLASEAIGKPLQILIPADRTADESIVMLRVERGERIEHYETVRRHKDGHLIDVAVSIAPILDEEGRVTGASRISRDVSEQRRTAAALEQHRVNLELKVAERTQDLMLAKAQAETANAAKSSFLARMSHEIRTPMNGIIGMTYLLQQELTDPSHIDRLGKIDSSARHLLALISDILDLSKIEAGRLTLEATDFNLQTVLEEVDTLMKPQVEAKGLRLERDCSQMDQWVRGDPTRLRQALLNYVGNAIKFTEKGAVTLKCRVVQERDDTVVVRFEVLDTGIGIPADKFSSLFQPFEQADTSTSRKYGGSGLGLAINRYLAELMGGEVGVTSTVGEGSTFWFTAVLQRAASPVSGMVAQSVGEAIAGLRGRYAGARVLVVEDNAISAEVATDLLEGAGLNVDVARDGLEALSKASCAAYEIVLMDMQMPGMDGIEATRAIRALPGWSARPIVALSAGVLAEDRRSCLEAGMNDFIAKPMQPESLYKTLLKWLDNRDSPADPSDAAVPMVVALRREEGPHANGPSEAGAHTILERIACLPGMDRERVMSFSATALRLVELLHAMVAMHGQDMNRVAACLQAGDTHSAMQIAHSLKGAASMLGARGLMLAAADLDAELRVRRNGPVDAASFEPDMEAVVDAMAALAAGLGMPAPESG